MPQQKSSMGHLPEAIGRRERDCGWVDNGRLQAQNGSRPHDRDDRADKRGSRRTSGMDKARRESRAWSHEYDDLLSPQ